MYHSAPSLPVSMSMLSVQALDPEGHLSASVIIGSETQSTQWAACRNEHCLEDLLATARGMIQAAALGGIVSGQLYRSREQTTIVAPCGTRGLRPRPYMEISAEQQSLVAKPTTNSPSPGRRHVRLRHRSAWFGWQEKASSSRTLVPIGPTLCPLKTYMRNTDCLNLVSLQ
jgi:hypothetical protein